MKRVDMDQALVDLHPGKALSLTPLNFHFGGNYVLESLTNLGNIKSL